MPYQPGLVSQSRFCGSVMVGDVQCEERLWQTCAGYDDVPDLIAQALHNVDVVHTAEFVFTSFDEKRK
jgi:hypothetical protein